MDLLAPIDGSDNSFRALEFAAGMARCYDSSLHVVHFTDDETEATDTILERARRVLDAEGVDTDPEIETNVDIEFQPGNRVGEAIVDLVTDRGYDHVVMGHRGSGTVERAILGSAAETVVRSERVPVTIIP